MSLICRNTYKRTALIVTGDFNAKVGGLHNCFMGTIGPFSVGQCNERGNMRGNFCNSNRLCIANTLFKKNLGRIWTWLSPDSVTRNQIDYILVKKTRFCDAANCEIATEPDILNHRMLRTRMKLKPTRIKMATKNLFRNSKRSKCQPCL